MIQEDLIKILKEEHLFSKIKSTAVKIDNPLVANSILFQTHINILLVLSINAKLATYRFLNDIPTQIKDNLKLYENGIPLYLIVNPLLSNDVLVCKLKMDSPVLFSFEEIGDLSVLPDLTKIENDIANFKSASSEYIAFQNLFHFTKEKYKNKHEDRILKEFNKVISSLLAGETLKGLTLDLKKSYEYLKEKRSFSVSSAYRRVIQPLFQGYSENLNTVSDEAKSDRYMTPDEVIDFMVTISEPKANEMKADLSFGSAGFLLQTAYKTSRTNEKDDQKLIGFEIDKILVDTANIAFSLANLSLPLIQNDSSLIKSKFLKEESFDLIIGNPPGSDSEESVFPSVEEIEKVVEAEHYRNPELFILRALQLLKEGGRLCLMIPSSFLSNQKYENTVISLRQTYSIELIVSLPKGICSNANSSMNIILIKKKKPLKDYRIFYGGIDGTSNLKSDFTDLLNTYQLFKTGKTPISDNIKEHLLENLPESEQKDLEKVNKKIAANDKYENPLEEQKEVYEFKGKKYSRNITRSNFLKNLYNYNCQVIGCSFNTASEFLGMQESVVHTHHIKFRSLEGKDHLGNMIVLCPTHHASFHGATVHLIDLKRKIAKLNYALLHLQVDPKHIAYVLDLDSNLEDGIV